MESKDARESPEEEALVAKMIPPLDVEFPKIVGDTMYYIAGGTIIEENNPPLSVDEVRHMLGVGDD